MSTVADAAKGVPYPSIEAGSVDQWSLGVFAALRGWTASASGSWSRWEPGYLLLEISFAAADPIEPAVLYTADEEVTVAFGMWETHLPEKGATAAQAADEAVSLIERWIAGTFKTLVFMDDAEKWCGTIPVFDDDVHASMRQSRDWLDRLAPTQVDLRSACRSEWRKFRFVDGRLLD